MRYDDFSAYAIMLRKGSKIYSFLISFGVEMVNLTWTFHGWTFCGRMFRGLDILFPDISRTDSTCPNILWPTNDILAAYAICAKSI